VIDRSSGVPKIAGFYELTLERPNLARLVHFGLVPEYRGKGIGPQLLLLAIDDAAASFPRAKTIYLTTSSQDHPSAKSVYEGRGFEPFEVWKEEWPQFPAYSESAAPGWRASSIA
jgi:GNAT superfamily N-acetyltransferase